STIPTKSAPLASSCHVSGSMIVAIAGAMRQHQKTPNAANNAKRVTTAPRVYGPYLESGNVSPKFHFSDTAARKQHRPRTRGALERAAVRHARGRAADRRPHSAVAFIRLVDRRPGCGPALRADKRQSAPGRSRSTCVSERVCKVERDLRARSGRSG